MMFEKDIIAKSSSVFRPFSGEPFWSVFEKILEQPRSSVPLPSRMSISVRHLSR